MDVSILTPVHNDERWLEASLRATLAQRTSLEFEVIAIDDGSSDGSAAIIERLAAQDSRLKLIRQPAGGEASALNAGLRQAAGRYIAIIEADVEAEPDWLQTLMPALDQPGVIGAGGMLLTPAEDPWIARLAGYEVEFRQDQAQRLVGHITSANALYKREAFELGGFRENLVNSCLDVDFNQRLCAAGHKLAFERNARVRHHYKGSLREYLGRQYAYARYRPFLRSLHLYRRDLWISLQLGLTLLCLASLALLPLSAWPFVLLLALTLLSAAPPALRLYADKRDPALLLFPAVMLLRNLAGLIGLGCGYLNKCFRTNQRRDG